MIKDFNTLLSLNDITICYKNNTFPNAHCLLWNKEKSAELTQQVENKEAPEILVEALEDEYVDDDKYQKYLDSLPKEERERLERESLEIAIAEEEREDYEREYENKIYQQISSKLDSAERMHENLQKDLAELNNQSKAQRNEARETEVDKDDNTRRM